MRLYRERRWPSWKLALSAAGMLVLVGVFWGGFGNVGQSADAEQLRVTEDAIRQAAVTCYAIEGSYPKNLEYLMEHYGIQVDTRKYVVSYEITGSNMLPYIEVVPRGGRTGLDTTSWAE